MNTNNTQTQNQANDPSVWALMKSIGTAESGGNYNAKGKSGEFGAYQFTKPTWQKWAGEHLGDSNAPMTPENQDRVAYSQIEQWGKQGYKPSQVASLWNSGKPDATGNVGVNKYGVKYNTPEYVKSVGNYYNKFMQGSKPQGPDENNPSSINGAKEGQPEDKPSVGGFLQNFLSSAGNFGGGLLNAVVHPVDTIGNLGSTALGLGEQGLNTIAGTKFNDENTQKAEGLENFYKERYGGVGNIAKTLYNDPVGVAADVSAAFGGLGIAADTAKLGDIGATLSKIGEATNPLSIPGKLIGRSSNVLEKSAIKNYENVLAPTTKANKAITPMVAEGMAKRGLVAPTREALLDKVNEGLEATHAKYSQAERAIPANTPIEIRPIMDSLEQIKKQYMVGDTVASPNAAKALDHISSFQDIIDNASAEGTISRESLTRFKEIWGKEVGQAKGYAGKTFTEGSLLDAQKEVTDAVRAELNKQFPNLGKINAERHFWYSAQQVLEDTINRKTGQTGLVRHIAFGGLGAIAGAPFGIPGTATGAYLFDMAGKIFQSPAWQTVSAATKIKLANAIASGQTGRVQTILNSIAQATTGATRINQATTQ